MPETGNSSAPWWISVVGTDTGVGKTCAAVALRDHFLEKKIRVAAIKPYVSGGDSGRWEDPDLLDPAGMHVPPARYLRPLSPYGAIRKGEREVGTAAVERYLEKVGGAGHEGIIVEGIGGVMVPLSREETWLDLHARHRWPSVLVAKAGLGTLNHTFLTLEALSARSIPILGVVLSATTPVPESEARENLEIIVERTGIVGLGCVLYADEALSARWRGTPDWLTVEAGIVQG